MVQGVQNKKEIKKIKKGKGINTTTNIKNTSKIFPPKKQHVKKRIKTKLKYTGPPLSDKKRHLNKKRNRKFRIWSKS